VIILIAVQNYVNYAEDFALNSYLLDAIVEAGTDANL